MPQTLDICGKLIVQLDVCAKCSIFKATAFMCRCNHEAFAKEYTLFERIYRLANKIKLTNCVTIKKYVILTPFDLSWLNESGLLEEIYTPLEHFLLHKPRSNPTNNIQVNRKVSEGFKRKMQPL